MNSDVVLVCFEVVWGVLVYFGVVLDVSTAPTGTINVRLKYKRSIYSAVKTPNTSLKESEVLNLLKAINGRAY